MTKITYQRLDEVLRTLGFSYRLVDRARVYEHDPTGAVIALAHFPDEDEALERHVVAVRAILDAYGIADPLDLDARLQRAG